MPDFPFLHCLLEFAQTHVYSVDNAIQSSHPLLPPSPPAFNPSQHQGLFQWVGLFTSGGQSTGVSASASLLPVNIQSWDSLFWAPWSPRDSRVFSSTTTWKQQFFCGQLSLWSNSHICTWLLWVTSLSLFTFMHWRRKWQPTPVFLSGESQRQRSLAGCRLWGCTESDTTEAT